MPQKLPKFPGGGEGAPVLSVILHPSRYHHHHHPPSGPHPRKPVPSAAVHTSSRGSIKPSSPTRAPSLLLPEEEFTATHPAACPNYCEQPLIFSYTTFKWDTDQCNHFVGMHGDIVLGVVFQGEAVPVVVLSSSGRLTLQSDRGLMGLADRV